MNYDAQSLNSHLVPKPVGKDKLELKGNNVFKALFAVSVMGTTLKDSPEGKKYANPNYGAHINIYTFSNAYRCHLPLITGQSISCSAISLDI